MFYDKQFNKQLINIKEYFDEIAEEFDSYYYHPKGWLTWMANAVLRKPVIGRRLKLTVDLISGLPTHKVLDIGCGSGVLAIPLAKSGYDVLGIDFSQRMIDIARERSSKENLIIDFRTSDFMSEQYSEYGSCVALGVLEYVSNPFPLLEKMLMTVKSDGLIIFDLPALFNFHTVLRLPYLLWRRQKAYFYTKKQCWEFLGRYNSQLSSVKFYNYGAGYLIAVKKK